MKSNPIILVFLFRTISCNHLSCKSSPVTGLEWSRVFQEIKVPRFHDNVTGRWSGYQPYPPDAFTPR